MLLSLGCLLLMTPTVAKSDLQVSCVWPSKCSTNQDVSYKKKTKTKTCLWPPLRKTKTEFCNPGPPSCLATNIRSRAADVPSDAAGSLRLPKVPAAPKYLLRLLGCFGPPLASVGIRVCKGSSLPMANYRQSLCLPKMYTKHHQPRLGIAANRVNKAMHLEINA